MTDRLPEIVEWTRTLPVAPEIAFSDIQGSPRYPAGMALRFARIKRYRLDKPAEEADTLQTVMEIFERETGGRRDEVSSQRNQR